MSVAFAENSYSGMTPEGEDYRALSSTAVASLVAGVLSVLCFLGWSMAILPLLGVLLGARALWSIRRTPDELTGKRLAVAGIVLSLACFAGGWGWLSYVYLTEVPDGYTRVSFSQLQPDASRQGEIFPPSALELDGKRVFIKGYVKPGAQAGGIKEFLLVRDLRECCFGDSTPKLTDMVLVRLQDPLRADFSLWPRGLAGTLHVKPDALGRPDSVLYSLDADYLK
ncbi:MAG: DUF4190 domain-containing protein [Planctomycetaceae bacterium]|nr:DUF4190 domain-containing protein [Planctomycetaceae bacterium]